MANKTFDFSWVIVAVAAGAAFLWFGNSTKTSGQRSAISCITKEADRYNRHDINYRNSCNSAVNYRFCLKSALASSTGGRWTCRENVGGPDQLIGVAFNANKPNMGMVEGALSTADVLVIACFPPKRPDPNDEINGRCV